MARADGLLVFDEEATELKAGETAPVQVLRPGLFHGTEPGFS